MQTACVVILFLAFGLIMSQTVDLVSDPGLYSLSGNQCSEDNAWRFRSNFIWSNTDEFVNARCDASFELPTDAISGVTEGEQTNINKALIPELPSVENPLNGFTESAGVVDMNSPCRAALWLPFRTPGPNPAEVKISLKIWIRSNEFIQQFLLDDSLIPSATELQYLRFPDGLLQDDFDSFPALIEQTNQIRIDIIRPDENGNFYDRAFSLVPEQIVVNIPIPEIDANTTFAVPAQGTDGEWVDVEYDATNDLRDQGLYALRIASAQSQIGVSWGVTDVHIEYNAGNRKRSVSSSLYEVEASSQQIFGTLTHVLPARAAKY